MGLFDVFKKKKEPTPQTKVEMKFTETPKPAPKKQSKTLATTFSTVLEGSGTTARQSIMELLGEDDKLSVVADLSSSGNLIWYVAYKGKKIGSIPKSIQVSVDKKYGPRSSLKIRKHSIQKEKSGSILCTVDVDVYISS